jgi:dihydrofolate reductase
MSRLVMFNLISLDGYFQGAKNWELDWHLPIVDAEFERLAIEQLQSADRLIFGRVTYEGMAAHWTTASGEIAKLMNSLPKVVFSRTLKEAAWANTTLVGGDAAAEVRKLKGIGKGNSFVFGSAKLSETLISEGLFDEYRVMVTPVVLGSGQPLFGRGLPRRKLKLTDVRRLGSGGVILRYEPSAGA